MRKHKVIKLVTFPLIGIALLGCGQNFDVNEKTPHQIGVYSSGFMLSKKTESGLLAYGPYEKLEPGSYTATFEVQSLGEDPKCNEAGFVDVNQTNVKTSIQTQLVKKLVPCDPNNESIDLNFNIEKSDDNLYEFRVFVNGSNSIKFKKVKLVK
jgi:hypothetical protein